MSPKKGKKQDVAELSLRSSEASLRLNRAVIRRVLETHECSVELILRTLRAHGYDTSVEANIDAPARAAADSVGPKSSQRAAQDARLALLRSNTHQAAKREAEKEENKDWLHKKYVTLSDFSSSMLVEVLSAIEPFSFSSANLRTVRSRGTALTKQLCFELLEFETGADQDFEFKDNMRYWPYAIAVLKFNAERRGNRGRTLLLPPSWGEVGLWSLDTTRSPPVAKHNYLGKSFPIDANVGPDSSLPLDDLYIKCNYSESRARLMCAGLPQWTGFLLTNLVVDHTLHRGLVAPCPPRASFARLSIEDCKRLKIAHAAIEDAKGEYSDISGKCDDGELAQADAAVDGGVAQASVASSAMVASATDDMITHADNSAVGDACVGDDVVPKAPLDSVSNVASDLDEVPPPPSAS